MAYRQLIGEQDLWFEQLLQSGEHPQALIDHVGSSRTRPELQYDFETYPAMKGTVLTKKKTDQGFEVTDGSGKVSAITGNSPCRLFL